MRSVLAAVVAAAFGADGLAWWLYRRRVERLLTVLLAEVRRRGAPPGD